MNGSDEQDELNSAIEKAPVVENRRIRGLSNKAAVEAPPPIGCEEERKNEPGLHCQWSTQDGQIFIPSHKSVPTLTPGLYEIRSSPSVGLYFEKFESSTEHLIRFKDANIDRVITDIERFWEREKIFNQYALTFKRGILLWGPPGTGKTSAVRLIMEDVVKRKGIVIRFDNPSLFVAGMKLLRQIQPNTPVVVMLEDLDAILQQYNESEVINVLDGVDKIDKVVFIATTNYPERLGARIVNRPSRFDRRYKIGHLNEQSRKLYFEHLFKITPDVLGGTDLDKWAKDTDLLSIAHLKELFVSAVIIGDDYDEVLKILKKMKDTLTTQGDAQLGFGRKDG